LHKLNENILKPPTMCHLSQREIKKFPTSQTKRGICK